MYSYSQIVGYVDNIEATRTVGNNQQYQFFKFYLNNGTGKRIQVVAWNDNVKLVEKLIEPNYVSYIFIYFLYHIIFFY